MKLRALLVAPLALAIGSAGSIAFASSAGATWTPPNVQSTSFPTGIGYTSPCDGSAVSTSGTGYEATATRGQNTLVGWADHESGGGYQVYQVSGAKFTALASSYTAQSNIYFVNTANWSKSFRLTVDETFYVDGNNAPVGAIITNVLSATCAS
jgi:hypothetical protein